MKREPSAPAGLARRTSLLAAVLLSVLSPPLQAASHPVTATGLIRGGDAARSLRVNITGWPELVLLVDDAGEYSHDVANWAEARVVADDGRVTWLDTLEPDSAEQAWGRFKRDNRSTIGGPLVIAGKTYDRGLGTHARSVLRFRLPPDIAWFEATVGVDGSRATGEGSVRFVVADRPVTPDPLPPEPPSPGALADELAALGRAIDDLVTTFGTRYPEGAAYQGRRARLEADLAATAGQPAADSERDAALLALSREVNALREDALLANPLLDFERLLLVKRRATRLGLPQNWQGNSSLPKTGFDNEIAVLSPVGPRGRLETLHRPEHPVYVGDLDLDFDADRLLFSSLGKHDRWQVYEMAVTARSGQASGEIRQLDLTDQPDVDHYDACYLPDGRILFMATAMFVGVPCVDGSDHVANLYLFDPATRNIRQLTFDQDHDWSPTVMNDGRVLYQRWEYADTPHSNTRLLFRMNPDGTAQEEFYGSNSYWPNSMFYARPIPGHPTKVVAIATGHHGVPRMGELVVLDPALGRQEAHGVVQRIPGYGQPVKPIIKDNLVDDSWPKFLHPYPLSEKHFLVSAQRRPDAPWGLYLVDVFDNFVLLAEAPGYALFEPVPLRRTPRPPQIPDRVHPGRQDALVYLTDIHRGEGLRGVPRGTVKSLRVFAYHWSYQGMGGLLGTLGLDGPWDVRRILGTVPVEEDGSAYFRVPANTPISVQPLDDQGRALQLMRSWFTAMPGENLSCVGCHEKLNAAPSAAAASAFRGRPPREIEPWRGPARGFGYRREVQPVIDRHCISCHDGRTTPDGRTVIDLRGTENIRDFAMITPGHAGQHGGKFSVGYANLHRFVRRPGIESDYHVLTPLEYHADTTELVQLLRKGHYGVQLDAEAWDRLVTWIDLNAPFHGNWSEEIAKPGPQITRRRELRRLYAGMTDDDAETLPPMAEAEARNLAKPADPKLDSDRSAPPAPPVPGWPFPAEEAVRRQQAAGASTTRKLDLGDGVTLELVLVPPGSFLMGDPASSSPDEGPATPVTVERSFWMARCEINNRQFNRFDPNHDSRVESKMSYQFGIHGLPLGDPEQPAVRVTWKQALEFCRWLSARTGEAFSLPTEAQWEWACRAGSAAAFSFGTLDADFSPFANLADRKIGNLASDPYTVAVPLQNPTPYDDYTPRDARFDDGGLTTTPVGRYRPNAWGLHDLHGNVWEWTRSRHAPYPYRDDERNDLSGTGPRIVRGGSWYDRPYRATAAYRLAFPPWQAVFNVGFRVVAEPRPAQVAVPNGKITPESWRNLLEKEWWEEARQHVEGRRAPRLTPAEDATGGCDGVTNGGYGFHTGEDDNPWWQVDLGQVVPLQEVRIWNRADLVDMARRANRFEVLLSDEGRQWNSVYRHDGSIFFGYRMPDRSPLRVRLTNAPSARYVRIQLPDRTFLHLDEVEVIRAGRWENVALHRPADQSSTSQWSTWKPRRTDPDHLELPFDWVISRGRTLGEERRREGRDIRKFEALFTEGEAEAGRFDTNTPPATKRALYFRLRGAVRELALASPLLDFDTVLFTKRVPGSYSHMSDQYYGWWSRPGGGLYLLRDFKSDSPTVECLTDSLFSEPGSFLRPALSHDGRRVLFAWCRHYPELAGETNKLDKSRVPEDAFYHLYEMNLDGPGLRRLTSGRYDNFDGRYLPDGRIVFLSTRRGQALQVGRASAARSVADPARPDCYVRCGGDASRPVAVYTLHTMNADGTDLTAISPFEMFEWEPSVSRDGTILYSRWDYVDRDNMPYMSLWSINPDGTNARLVYGNYTKSPHCTFEPRSIPGSRKIIFTASGHHAQTMGSLVLLDPTVGTEGEAPITRLTPDVAFPEIEGWPRAWFANPWPLSERAHLVSWGTEELVKEGQQRPASGMGIHFFDAAGALELLYRDPDISSMYPMPVRPTTPPPQLASQVRWDGPQEGRFLLSDVYRGLVGVPRGEVHALRVVAIPAKTQPWMNDPPLGLTRDDPGKTVLGTVPVESDGSAYFRVPSGVALFVQALDARGRAVQTMRSATHVQPGQTLGCVGCHDSRQEAPPPVMPPLAARRSPSKLSPGPEGSWPLRFDRLVQPVLDERCVGCHRPDGPDPKAATFVLGADRAYESLAGYGQPSLRDTVLAAYRDGYSRPGQGPARNSPLLARLDDPSAPCGHGLTAAEFDRLTTWLDTYGQRQGHFSDEQERELEQLRRDVFAIAVSGNP